MLISDFGQLFDCVRCCLRAVCRLLSAILILTLVMPVFDPFLTAPPAYAHHGGGGAGGGGKRDVKSRQDLGDGHGKGGRGFEGMKP